MRLLVVQLASLGDVVRAMPAVQDIRRARPGSRIDWLVDPAWAPLVRRVEGVADVIAAPVARWREACWSRSARSQFKTLRERLARQPYDAVVDLQGVTRSALLARLAPLAAGGHRHGPGNATEGAAFDVAARWLSDRPVRLEPARIHLVDRARLLASRALGYAFEGSPAYGLGFPRAPGRGSAPTVVFVHGSRHDARLWPHAHWVTLGKRVLAQGWRIALPQAGEAEQTRAELIAAALQFERAPQVEVWPAMKLDALVDRFATVQGVIGVEGGLSQLAVGLGLPHVQIHNAMGAWRTGPQPSHGQAHQVSVEGRSPPSADAVGSAWQAVLAAAGAAPR